MKHQKFLVIMIIVAMAVSLSSHLHVFAENAKNAHRPCEKNTILTHCDCTTISDALDSYFAQRKNEYLCCKDGINDIEHQNYVYEWSASLSITINSSRNNYIVRDIIEDRGTTIKVLVYEWVTLDYTWRDPNTGDTCNDTMGFGTDHAMTINTENGIIENDSYIEINEYTHYAEEDLQYISFDNPTLNDENEIHEEARIPSITRTQYSASAAVAYSNQWCGQSVEGQSTPQNPSNYNPLYYYYGNDCCNFVSQCIHAGNLPMVTGEWKTTLNPNATMPVQDTNHIYSTHSWISVPKFKKYMVDAGYHYLIASTTSKCLIGNPIFWLISDGYSNNHNMLIVGKLGTNTVLVNAHNKDAYRFPRLLTNKIYHTIDIVHNYTAQTYSNMVHKCTCSVCGDEFTEPHSWVYNGTYYICSVCGETSSYIITPNSTGFTNMSNCTACIQ